MPQDVPTAFWRTHGADWFDGVTYLLHGPERNWCVKTGTYTSGKQTFCMFTTGWAGFVAANNLKIGDTLTLTKVGPVEFRVTKT